MNEREINIEAKTENLSRVMEFLNSALEEFGCPMKVKLQLEIALEEMFVNVAMYAYSGRAEPGRVSVRLEKRENPSGIAVTLTDSGIPFNPLMKEAPDITLPLEKRKIGGLGIFMVRKSMDEVLYEYRDGKNVLTFIKNTL